jgi:formylglycine-generating enzyme required for sulfatase activity
MSGNVWEWVGDRAADYPPRGGSYASRASIDPLGSSSGRVRFARGGSWFYEASTSRVSKRNFVGPNARLHNLGFRLVRTAD